MAQGLCGGLVEAYKGSRGPLTHSRTNKDFRSLSGDSRISEKFLGVFEEVVNIKLSGQGRI